ncbi:MAG: hypothetical protein OQK66_04565 [Prosthecochloris sp.]|uniref:ATP synthase I n=2 Tax=Prosthecochloris TaxID=1101 RepID=B4S6E7_PROA2|nr:MULTISPECIES: hypothetical protein [Prosthecochloris]ACF47249.1 conserved hypothetical protein [Prosthecochloris aestuarii DSM 271]MCW8798222.1 hypothetical protein [Prosthecochloris sp.]RDD29237.1 hypothetical protein CR161_00110 [Prosthecochloris sp. ZM]
MKPLFDFLLKMFILTVILWGVTLWGSGQYRIDLYAVFAAWFMVAVNTLIGYLLFEYAFEKEQAVFTKVVFGGLVVRLLVLMVLVAVIIVQQFFTVSDFILSFFAFYCIYVIIEILGYQNRNKQKKKVA